MLQSGSRVDILGCPVDVLTLAETVRIIERAVVEGRRIQIVPCNVDYVMKARRDPIFAAELRRADFVVPDGMIVVWAASLLGTPLAGRVSGTEVVWQCAAVSASTGAAVAMIGSAPGVAERAAAEMCRRYPGARLCPIPTPFPLTDEASREIVARVRREEAKILLVALGAPRGERWIQRYFPDSGANVALGIGSAFDIISGDRPRAPDWMQARGLEWFHRMLQEPRRLGRRYLIEDMPFLYHLAREILQRRVGRLRAHT